MLGTLGGVGGIAISVTALGTITPTLDARAARVAVVVSGVTLGGGLGASVGVLAAARLLSVEGNVRACLIGAFAGGLASALVEPLLYLIGIPEPVAEFLGFLFLPMVPAVGATFGFNYVAEAPH